MMMALLSLICESVRRTISFLVRSLTRIHGTHRDLEKAYREMAQDEEREAEALAWIEGVVD